MNERVSGFASIRILIVEDEFVIAMDLEDQIRDWGCTHVRIATSIGDAEEALAAEPVDLLIADFNLGRDSSADLVKNQRASGIPVVLLTGQTINREMLASMGGPVVVQKPVQPGMLRQVAQAMMGVEPF